jgi:threonyl-tRNA synthetase
MEEQNQLYKIRHTAEHVLTMAMMKLWPDKIIPAMGPAIETGFYFDFDKSDDFVLSETDLPNIEKEMSRIIKQNLPMTRVVVDEVRARELFADNPYKLEWIEEAVKNGDEITVYWLGEMDSDNGFVDLCAGPHAKSSGEIKAFKLLSIAGAYWHGDEKNKMLTRVYGTAFETREELDKYVWQLEEAKKRDHRKIGEEMDLFHFDESIGKGLPIWLPKGNIIKEELENWAKETETKWGYDRVTTPIITKEDLFYTSGHLPLYKDSMYAPIEIEDENYYIKPMNCPFHHKAFGARPKTYRDLPVKMAEYGWCHRYEDSGSLFGLMRVRSMQMNDAHIYVQKERAVEEFVEVIKLHEYYYKILGIDNYEMELALRDPSKMDKYHGDESDWQEAEQMTIEAMEKSGVPYKIVHTGAAFYGPKMDFQIYSSIGRQFTASTNQLDLYMGKRFGLQYVDRDGSMKTPVIIHRAPLGTHERFIGFLIEHFGGAFPLWLSPVQIAVLPISEKVHDYASKVVEQMKSLGIRVDYRDEAESLGKKIRNAEKAKTPYMLVIGEKEAEAGQVSVRARGQKDLGVMSLEAVTDMILKEIKDKTIL